MIVNFFIISGSGQAAVTMPLLAPLGDLVGVQRQLSVLIFQLGDGFSNAIFPTSGILIASLGLAGVPYSKWLKMDTSNTSSNVHIKHRIYNCCNDDKLVLRR